MNYYNAQELADGSGYHYVSHRRSGTHPVGYCSLADDTHVHATADEARECFRQYLRRLDRVLMAQPFLVTGPVLAQIALAGEHMELALAECLLDDENPAGENPAYLRAQRGRFEAALLAAAEGFEIEDPAVWAGEQVVT